MRALINALMIVAISAGVTAQAPIDVAKTKLAAPATVAELDMGKLKGAPFRVGWSPDGAQFYVQTVEGPFHERKATHHYLIDATDGKVQNAEAEPAWFASFWDLKSNKSSPDAASVEIGLSSESRVEKTTSTPTGGDLARGGTGGTEGTSSTDAISAAHNSQAVSVRTMKLHGQTIGEFINSVIVPGMTFAWAPKGSQAIVYSDVKNGKLVLMDNTGKRQDLDGTKDALFPMWSGDGARLAWLQRDGKKKFALKVAQVK
jgi:hypothetical protein